MLNIQKEIKIYCCIFLILQFLSSCKKDSNISPEIPISNEIIESIPTGLDTLKPSKRYLLENLPYGTNYLNTMDICLPENRNLNTPVIIFIHGGGWNTDDKFFFTNDLQQYTDSGFASISINYRLADTSLNIGMREILNDVDSALLFVINNSMKFKISSNRIGITGYSAGGHLALMASYSSYLKYNIKACASVAGPTDLIDSIQRTNISWFNDVIKNAVGTGLNTEHDTILYKKMSPFWNVNANSKPTLLIHGTQDGIVSVNNSIKLQQKLNNFFVYNSFFLLLNKDHGIWNDSRDKILQWFRLRL